MTLPELRARVQPRTSNIYDRFFTRQVSIFLTAALAPTAISANQISAFNCLVGAVACVLLAFGTSTLAIGLGVLLVHLYAVLDSVDGELARLRRTFSLRGLFLEDISAFIMIVAFPLAIGLYVLRSTGRPELLVLAIVYAAFGRNGMAVARRALIRSIQTRRPVGPEDASHGSQNTVSALRRLIDEHVLNHTYIRPAVSSTLFIEVAIGSSLRATEMLMAFYLLALLLREVAGIGYLLRSGVLDSMLDTLYRDARMQAGDSADVDVFRLAGQ